MYIREWLGIDLTTLPAGRTGQTRPADWTIYEQFYAALESGLGKDDRARAEKKRALGKAISRQIFDDWEQQHGKPARILALAVGNGLAESSWLEEGRDVTLHEGQQLSIRDLCARFPAAPTILGDVCEIEPAGTYDIVVMLALDYALSHVKLQAVLAHAFRWLEPGGWLVLESVTILSVRQLAAEIVKAFAGRYQKIPHIYWGWWRTPGEMAKMARTAGLLLRRVYYISGASEGLILVRRPKLSQSWPPLRQGDLTMLFEK